MSAPIRVAHIVGTAMRTGVESHLIALLPAFDPSQVQPTLFVPGPGPLVETLQKLKVPTEFGAPRRKLAFSEGRALARRWAGSFDVVHAHGARSIFWAARAVGRAKIQAFVVTLHEMRWINMRPSLKRLAWVSLEVNALKRADRIITVAPAMREEIARRHPEWVDRLRMVHGTAPLLLDPEKIPYAEPARREDGVLRLICVARHTWVKGYDTLLQALRLLRERGVSFTLDSVGEGELLKELQGEARRLGLADCVRWRGVMANVVPLLLESHVYVLATRSEGLPVAVLEGMAVGLPVVGTRASGMEEVCVHGETGLLIDLEPESDRPRRFADAIETLARDPALAKRMGYKAAQRSRVEFSPRRIAAETAQVYREALDRHSAPAR